jgi:hypothetical protein
MNKSINLAAIIMLSITANSAMATTLPEHVDTHQEKAKQLSTHASSQAQTSTQLTKQQKATPLARVLAQSENKLLSNSFNEDRTLNLEISELKDNSGLVYLGGKVSLAELSRYLEQLKTELGEEQYAIYRQLQAARDHQSFHVTLVNPYEYQTINKDKLKLATQFRVILHGLGRVENDEKNSYFVVASSPDGQFIRQNLLLNNKDFHVTLGFFPEDIYGVSKGRDTLINK